MNTNKHYHDMEMRFPNGDLNWVFTCECGLTTTDNDQAIRWNGKSWPRPPVHPLGVIDADLRRLEKTVTHAMRYGAGTEQIKKMLDSIPLETFWQRAFRWWREDVAQTHHKGCGGQWRESGASGWSSIRVYYVCDKCHDEGTIYIRVD